MRHRRLLIGAGLALLTLLVYLPGLDGSFLFDDTPNILSPLRAWLTGSSNWVEFVLGNQSGLLGRPASMLSFAANGASTGLAVWPFKLTNLAIHLACGGVIYVLLARLLRHDALLAARAPLAAGLIAAVWLLHPLQVSTVLYVVQRMSQLSALFMLLALWAFVSGREALQAGRLRQGLLSLFLLVPACTVFAMASKENGVLVPLLCAVIELGYFRPNARGVTGPSQSQRALHIFLVGFIVLPLLMAMALLVLRPGLFLDGYDGRLFTLGQRLLSEPRALMDYVGILLLPRGAALGLYTDDFQVSHGLLDPPSTLWAMLGLVAWAFASLMLKKRIPAFFAGTWFFFGGHALESTIFPLEIYFEHRNYLPSIGVFLAVAGILGFILPRVRAHLPERSRTWPFAAGAVLLVLLLASATAVRSSVWRTWVGIAEQGVQQHPLSTRAHLDKISILLALNRPQDARTILVDMLDFPNPGAYSIAAFNLAWLDCKEKGEVAPDDVERIRTLVGRKLQLFDLFGGEKLGNFLIKEPCTGLTRVQLASILRDMAGSAGQREGNTPVWRLRFMASRLLAEDNLLPQAIEQAALAWMTDKADPAVGVYLINLYLAAGDRASADILLPQVRSQIQGWDQRNLQQLEKVLAYFADTKGAEERTDIRALPETVPDTVH